MTDVTQAHYDPFWHSWRHLLRWLGDNLVKDKSNRATREMALKELAGIAQQGQPGANDQDEQILKDDLKRIRKASGNTLLMSSMLMHNLNMFNMRVLLLVGRPLWTEHADLARLT